MGKAVNPWRGERVLRLPGCKAETLSVSLDGIARLMNETGTDTLEALQDSLSSRKPDLLKSALAIVAGEARAEALWPHVNGAAGLTAVYAAIAGAVSGLTPEEQEEAKKAEADRAESMQVTALRLLARAAGQSNDSLSGNG